MATRKAVAYYRVSTKEQGDSGLGLEAQRRCVRSFCESRGFTLVDTFQEQESGKRDDRPELATALAACKAKGATLIIAKIDRLSRKASFILKLRDSDVPFVACDLPEANTMTIGIMAVMAQAEREAISSRTKAALAGISEPAKRRRAEAGRRNLTSAARHKGAQAKREKALAFYNGSLVLARALRSEGWSYPRIAAKLNEAGATARRGGKITATHVYRLLKMGGWEGHART